MRCLALLPGLGLSLQLLGSPVSASEHSYKPPKGFVPDRATAIRVAEAVLIPVYGKSVIQQELPLNGTLRNGVWIVTGALPRGPKGTPTVGGVAEVHIARRDARILRTTHGQ
jgi:hypothetical protein